jgi:carbamoyltransferase
MNILGISGNLRLVHQTSDGDKHDAAAVLVKDGKVVSAIEEERLNRVKHTDKFPLNAIKFVLNEQGIGFQDLDQICYYGLPAYCFEGESSLPLGEKIQTILQEEFDCRLDEKKLYFVHHHIAHAVSAYYMSGFDRSLVLSIDGQGDGISGMVVDAGGKKTEVLEKYPVKDSLGIYYLHVIHVLGYKQFDEYKVMGLAPYGDPAVYRDLFKGFYKLLPQGKYQIDLNQVKKLYLMFPCRQKEEPFNQDHKDIAAALQESLEEIVFHILRHYQKTTGHTNLCLAGGVAHNCTLNGKILYSGLFDNVFVQPASHDAGCALGAALYRYHELHPDAEFRPLDHLYWGSRLPDNQELERKLACWKDFIHVEKRENIAADAASLISEGAVIGWVQGQSEFGPRALGNRSIVADPRPPENKDIINEMVKKREGYRPFAPSVLAEHAADYYDLPCDPGHFAYMIFVVKVNEDKQKILGAVTHVDGTSRIQTVSKDTNPRYWGLIDEFRALTGVPVVLNTSFNNNAEPIVDSVEDAVACFLTTKLNRLVIGDFLISKKEMAPETLARLIPNVPPHNVLTHTHRYVSPSSAAGEFSVANNFDNGYSSKLSPLVFRLLTEADGKQPLAELLNGASPSEQEAVLAEIRDLWGRRFIRLRPIGKEG